jgi:four helix bundle protein
MVNSERQNVTDGQRGNGMAIDITHRTFQFAVRIVRLCQVLDERPGVARVLGRQQLRAGTSIGANVEEGQGGQSRADFASKLAIACKEARETHYWLRLLIASGVMPEKRIAEMLKECTELVSILTSISKKSKRPPPNI